MEQSVESNGAAARAGHTTAAASHRVDPIAEFRAKLRRAPLRTALELLIEYGMFASALLLAAALFVSRVPLRLLDRALGLSLRERFIALIARISPG